MRVNLLRAMVLAIPALGLTIVSASAANTSVPKNNTGKAAAAAASPTANPTVTTLHKAKILLETAIHDYDGHRAKAVEEIHHAIKELAPHHTGHKATGTTAAKGTGAKETTTPGETQAQSDAQLKQALELLNGLNAKEISNAKAVTHLQTAIAELNTALKIK